MWAIGIMRRCRCRCHTSSATGFPYTQFEYGNLKISSGSLKTKTDGQRGCEKHRKDGGKRNRTVVFVGSGMRYGQTGHGAERICQRPLCWHRAGRKRSVLKWMPVLSVPLTAAGRPGLRIKGVYRENRQFVQEYPADGYVHACR